MGEDASQGAVRRLVNTFFGGSASAAVAGLLGQANVTAQELDQLDALLQERRRSSGTDADGDGTGQPK